MLNLLRVLVCVVYGTATGVAAVRGVYRPGPRNRPVRGVLFACAALSAAAFFGQLTLFGTPFTVRTLLSVLAAAADLGWLFSLLRHGHPVDPEI